MKLRKWVKIVLSIIVFLSSTVIYTKTGHIGELAQSSSIYTLICVLAWIWLVLGQSVVYLLIWEEK